MCSLTIKNSKLQLNKANIGGAIYYDLIPPKLIKSVIKDNQASTYGNEIGSYPAFMRFIGIPKTSLLVHSGKFL